MEDTKRDIRNYQSEIDSNISEMSLNPSVPTSGILGFITTLNSCLQGCFYHLPSHPAIHRLTILYS